MRLQSGRVTVKKGSKHPARHSERDFETDTMLSVTVTSQVPTKELDLDLLVFVERYATNLLKWDLLTYFGRHPDEVRTVTEIASLLGRSERALRPELGDLVMLGLLEQTNGAGAPRYRLTPSPPLRSLVQKFARPFNNTQTG